MFSHTQHAYILEKTTKKNKKTLMKTHYNLKILTLTYIYRYTFTHAYSDSKKKGFIVHTREYIYSHTVYHHRERESGRVGVCKCVSEIEWGKKTHEKFKALKIQIMFLIRKFKINCQTQKQKAIILPHTYIGTYIQTYTHTYKHSLKHLYECMHRLYTVYIYPYRYTYIQTHTHISWYYMNSKKPKNKKKKSERNCKHIIL